MKDSTKNLILSFGDKEGVSTTAYVAIVEIVTNELGTPAAQRLVEFLSQSPDGRYKFLSNVNPQGLLYEMEPNKTITLPVGNIVLNVDQAYPGAGTIQSSLKEDCPYCQEPGCNFGCEASKTLRERENPHVAGAVQSRLFFNACIDGIEAMILGCACAGIDVETPAFLEAIETAIQGATNNA